MATLVNFVNKKTGQPLARPRNGDLLARLIVTELDEAYSRSEDEINQLEISMNLLSRARDMLYQVIVELDREQTRRRFENTQTNSKKD